MINTDKRALDFNITSITFFFKNIAIRLTILISGDYRH